MRSSHYVGLFLKGLLQRPPIHKVAQGKRKQKYFQLKRLLVAPRFLQGDVRVGRDQGAVTRQKGCCKDAVILPRSLLQGCSAGSSSSHERRLETAHSRAPPQSLLLALGSPHCLRSCPLLPPDNPAPELPVAPGQPS